MLSLDHYSICGVIGEGGFGEVFLAIHKETGIAVAIKKIPRISEEHPDHQAMIEREIDILCNLEHPCIYKLFDFIRNDDYYFLIFEYLDNGKLLDFVNNNGRLLEKTARQYFTQLISALKYLNEKSIAHRDIKAENILLDRYFNLRLIDFGLSNYFDPKFPIMRSLCGCTHYAPPEMLSRHPYTPSADVWSSGILLYAVCAGYLPFSDTNVPRLVEKVKNEEPSYPNFFSDELVDLLKKMLDKNPIKRISINEIMQHPWFTAGSLPSNFDSLSDEMQKINDNILKNSDDILSSSKLNINEKKNDENDNNNNNENENGENDNNNNNENENDNKNEGENVQLTPTPSASSYLDQSIIKTMKEDYKLNTDRIFTKFKYSKDHIRVRPNNETVSYEILKRLKDTDEMAQMYPTVKSHLPGGNNFSVLSLHTDNDSNISFNFDKDSSVFIRDDNNNTSHNDNTDDSPHSERPATRRFTLKSRTKSLFIQSNNHV